MKNQMLMDGDSRNLEKNFNWESSDPMYDDRSFLQPVRVRYSSVLANPGNWNTMASEFRNVLYSGILFWTLHLLTLAL